MHNDSQDKYSEIIESIEHKLNKVLNNSLNIIGKNINQQIFIIDYENEILIDEGIYTHNERLSQKALLKERIQNIVLSKGDNIYLHLKYAKSILGTYLVTVQYDKLDTCEIIETEYIKDIIELTIDQCSKYIDIDDTGFSIKFNNSESISPMDILDEKINDYIEYCMEEDPLDEYYKKISERQIKFCKMLLKGTKGNEINNYYTIDYLNNISKTSYESSYSKGKLVIVDKDHDLIKYFKFEDIESTDKVRKYDIINLKNKIELRKDKSARKIIEMSNENWLAISDGVDIYGMIKRSCIDYNAMITFTGNYSYEIQFKNKKSIKFKHGYPLLTQDSIDIHHIEYRIKKEFVEYNIENLKNIIKEVKKQPKGSMLIISNKSHEEARRLKYQSTLIRSKDIFSDLSIVNSISRIDGCILVDPHGCCNAIGVILDGVACHLGDSSRGARYNSAVKYIYSEINKYKEQEERHECMAIVVSEDGIIDRHEIMDLDKKSRAINYNYENSINKFNFINPSNGENIWSMEYLKEEYDEFKIVNNRTPYLLLNYIKYEGAPDPIKFINKEKTYIGFVAKMEKDDNLKKLLENSNFESALKELCSKLPLKRVYEFAILKYLLKHDNITLVKAKSEILKYIKYVDKDSVIHSFEYLNQDYYDSVQIKGKLKLVDYLDDTLSRSKEFDELLNNKEYRKYIEDVINYGIFRYEKEFKEEYYGVPFFKLYEQYQMIDAALLSNYRKTHTAFRGSGLLTNGNDYFLFIDLHKEDGMEEKINYKDKFISEGYFQWQSPNATKQESDRGKNIIFNKNRDINIHLFVRPYRELYGKSEPFIYLGKGDTVEYEGEKPITVKLKLENELPISIYREFVEKV
ncbi:DUF3427 domain-containing protein [[Clostridium] dakarense]|uniref:DUF3427 domain-containing protein n=1 Tax=Faecalimicrobium dakarense TaxID=1301100 RepID=UPI0004B1E494|nr:DUF3427 domain-containing protein [[Clostridium] dakarense]